MEYCFLLQRSFFLCVEEVLTCLRTCALTTVAVPMFLEVQTVNCHQPNAMHCSVVMMVVTGVFHLLMKRKILTHFL